MKVIFKDKNYKSYQDLLEREYRDKPITILTNGESNAKLKKGITEKADVMLLHMLPHNKADVLMGRKVKRTWRKETGTIKWFDPSKGYGFLIRDKGGDLFVHFKLSK